MSNVFSFDTGLAKPETRLETHVITLDPLGMRFQNFKNCNKHLDLKTFQAIRGSDLLDDDVVSSGLATQELANSSLLTLSAKGCAASHRALWNYCISSNKNLLILEDDVYTHSSIIKFINEKIHQLVLCGVIFFGINTDSVLHSTSPEGLRQLTFFQPSYPNEHWINSALEKTDHTDIVLHQLHHAFGTCAYFLTPKGALKFNSMIFPLSLETIEIPFISSQMPRVSVDRFGCAIYSKIQAMVSKLFLAYSLNSDSATRN